MRPRVVYLSALASSFIFIGCDSRSEEVVTVDSTFNLTSEILMEEDASVVFRSLRELLIGTGSTLKVNFSDNVESLTFDVLLAEDPSWYMPTPALDENGDIVTYGPPLASPPGDVLPNRLTLNAASVTVGSGERNDEELSSWLKFYAGAIKSAEERSVLVLRLSPGVRCQRLYQVLRMISEENLHRILIER